jgi:hypothetical protein
MLTIKGILKLQNVMCQNRQVWLVTENTNETGQPYYSFRFKPMLDNKGYNKATEVRLGRDINQGEYQIFVMGLQMSSRHFVTIDDIKSKDGLASEISKVLAKAKWWWENEAI